MGYIIHTKKTQGGLRFRLWSTRVDGYVTNEMNEAELRECTAEIAVRSAIEAHNREIDDSRDPNADWDKPLNQ